MSVLRLHDGFILVEGVRWEMVEVTEVVVNLLCVPFNSEVVVVLHGCVFSYLEVFWFVLFIRKPFHLRIPLEPTALSDTKNQKYALVFFKSLSELSSRPESRRPHIVKLGDSQAFFVNRLEDKELCVFLVNRAFVYYLLPTSYLLRIVDWHVIIASC